LLKNIWRWRKYTGERFGIDQLISRHIDHCFVPVAEGGWDVGGREAAQTVWFSVRRLVHRPDHSFLGCVDHLSGSCTSQHEAVVESVITFLVRCPSIIRSRSILEESSHLAFPDVNRSLWLLLRLASS
jgi:hypothetical protein